MLNDIFEKKKKSIIVPCTAAFSGGAVPHWPLMQRRHCSLLNPQNVQPSHLTPSASTHPPFKYIAYRHLLVQLRINTDQIRTNQIEL